MLNLKEALSYPFSRYDQLFYLCLALLFAMISIMIAWQIIAVSILIIISLMFRYLKGLVSPEKNRFFIEGIFVMGVSLICVTPGYIITLLSSPGPLHQIDWAYAPFVALLLNLISSFILPAIFIIAATKGWPEIFIAKNWKKIAIKDYLWVWIVSMISAFFSLEIILFWSTISAYVPLLSFGALAIVPFISAYSALVNISYQSQFARETLFNKRR